MTRYTNTLPPVRINPEHQHALQLLANKLQTNPSQLTRQAIAELLDKHGFNPSSTFVPKQSK